MDIYLSKISYANEITDQFSSSKDQSLSLDLDLKATSIEHDQLMIEIKSILPKRDQNQIDLSKRRTKSY